MAKLDSVTIADPAAKIASAAASMAGMVWILSYSIAGLNATDAFAAGAARQGDGLLLALVDQDAAIAQCLVA
jgi:hypothetical protein